MVMVRALRRWGIVIVALMMIALVDGAATGSATAQTYPNRPIKMVVPFAPGGADVMARLIADHLTKVLGQPVVIENRPGAGGAVGAKYVTMAEPDGHTLILASPGPITVAQSVNKNLDYDSTKHLAAVALIAATPFVLVVNPQVPAQSVAELVTYAKANPGKVNFASPGFGTSSHLLGELFSQRTGAQIVHVPYRGAAPAITDLVGGQVQMFFDNIRNVQSHIQSGRLRALAVTSEARTSEMPELPTMAEAGVAGFQALYWNGVLAPAGTPASIVEKLNTVINDGLRTSEMQKAIVQLGMSPRMASPGEFSAFIAAEIQTWTTVARASNL